jgi:hypothetical protein
VAPLWLAFSAFMVVGALTVVFTPLLFPTGRLLSPR